MRAVAVAGECGGMIADSAAAAQGLGVGAPERSSASWHAPDPHHSSCPRIGHGWVAGEVGEEVGGMAPEVVLGVGAGHAGR